MVFGGLRKGGLSEGAQKGLRSPGTWIPCLPTAWLIGFVPEAREMVIPVMPISRGQREVMPTWRSFMRLAILTVFTAKTGILREGPEGMSI